MPDVLDPEDRVICESKEGLKGVCPLWISEPSIASAVGCFGEDGGFSFIPITAMSLRLRSWASANSLARRSFS